MTQRIYALLGVTALLMAMAGAGYSVIASLETQQVAATLRALKSQTQTQFALLGQIIEQEEKSLQGHWQNALPLALQQLSTDPFATSPHTLNQIATALQVDEVYLLNRDAQIVVGSSSQERDLNLLKVSSHLGEQLQQGIGSGAQIHNHLAVSLRTGQLMMYHYFAPEGQNFWLETAVALKPFLQRQQVLSERYPLFKAWFKGGISSALPVSNMDILLQRENGQYSVFSERLIDARASTVAAEPPGRHYVTLPLGENMAFANAILAVDLDTSAFQAAKRTLLLSFVVLWLFAMYATRALLRRNAQQTMATAVQLLQQYAAGAQPAVQSGFQALQQYALAQQQAQAEQLAQQRAERSEMAYAAQQRTQSLEAEIARRRDSEATLAELRLGLEMANRRLIEANTSLVHDAETDQLTTCGNRRAFEQMAAAEISRAIRYAHPVCLLMLDIDFFKRVNDEFGHPMGDQVLIYLADLLRKQIRPSDQLFRWGGEEFALLVPGVSLEQGRVLAEKLRLSVAETTFPHLQPLTISIGVAPFVADFSIEDWVKNADAALYAAKTNGRNRVELAV